VKWKISRTFTEGGKLNKFFVENQTNEQWLTRIMALIKLKPSF